MSAEVGLSVTHRRYVKYGDAHYAGNLVDGAYVLGLFGDVATEVSSGATPTKGCSRPIPTCSFGRRRSRQLAFEARVVCRGDAARGESAASVLAEPVVVVTATGTVVVPPPAG